MFGCPADQIRSFSETFSLLPYNEDEDDESSAASDRVLTAEEFIERFKNRDDIFTINENIKLNSSEIITLLCAILACSTYGKEDIKQTRMFSGLIDLCQMNISDVDTMLLPVSSCFGDCIADVLLQNQLTASGNDYHQNVKTIVASITDVRENRPSIQHDSWNGHSLKTSLLSLESAPRGPPLQVSVVNETVKISEYMSSLKCKNDPYLKGLYEVFTKNKINSGSATLIGCNESNYSIGLLHYCKNISSLLLQADRRHLV
jgi:hypothetical protein